MKFWYFWRTSFFWAKRDNFMGQKSVLPFSKLMWGKVKFCNGHIHVFAEIYANTWQGGHICRPPPVLIRLKVGLMRRIVDHYKITEKLFCHFSCLMVEVVFTFSIYFSLLSYWLIGKTCSYFLFQRLAEGSSWLASVLVTKELVEKMTGEYDLRNKHEVKRKVQLQFLRQVIVQLETFLSR